MFENSLIALDTRKFQRPRWLSLPVAVTFHLIVGTAVGFAQYWQIAEVPEPPLNVIFFELSAPPPPPPPAPPPRPTAPQPPPRPTPVVPDTQPRDIPEEIPDAPANEDIGVVSLVPGSVTSGPGVPNSVFTGPGNIHAGPGVAEAPAPRDEILTVGGAVSKPVFLDGVKPKYTEVARKARLQGTVIVEAIIDEQGRVVDARVLKGLPMGLDREAVAAVQQWRYKPAYFQGRPVKVRFSLTVNFQVQ